MGDEQIYSDGDPEHTISSQFGNYTLLEPIGDKGGMGIVHRAIQHRPRRLVAIKRIKRGVDASGEEIERFKMEVELVAQFDHPNIVRVLECGEYDGEMFYSMQLVEGGSLRQRLKEETPLTPQQAAMIIRTVADAVRYAHQREVIHRDLKPENILFDQVGNPLVIDFGCAKRLNFEGSPTVEGEFLGTWLYMSPEQVEKAKEVNEAADIFSLGAVLYECLVGRTPYQAGSVLDTIKQLTDTAFQPPTPRELKPQISRDMEAICLKCIRRDPAQRYQSAGEMVDDLDRFLAGETPSARALTPPGRFASWFNRHPAASGAIAFAILMIVGIVFALMMIQRRENMHLELKYRELYQANLQTDRATRIADERLYMNRMTAAYQAWKDLRLDEADKILLELKQANLDSLASWEWEYLRQQLSSSERHSVILEHDHEVRCLDVASDGKQIFFGDSQGNLGSWVFSKGNWIRSKLNEFDGVACQFDSIADIAISSDDARLAVGTVDSGQLHVLGSNAWKEPRTVSEDGPVTRVAFTPDGEYVIAATGNGTLAVHYKNGSGLGAKTVHSGPIYALDVGEIDYVPHIVTGGRDGKVNLWNFRTHELRSVGSATVESSVIGVALHPLGKSLAAATQRGFLHQWFLSAGPKIEIGSSTQLRIDDTPSPVYSLDYNRDGSMLATAGEDRVVRLWDAGALSKPLDQRTGHSKSVLDVSFLLPRFSKEHDPFDTEMQIDGERSIVSVADDMTIRIWKPYKRYRDLIAPGQPIGAITALCFSNDNQRLYAANSENQIPVWDLKNESILDTFDGHRSPITAICTPPNSNWVASLDDSGRIFVWRRGTDTIESKEIQIDSAKSLAFDPSTDRLVVLAADGSVTSIDPNDLHAKPGQAISASSLHSTSDSLLAVGNDGVMRKIANGVATEPLITIPDGARNGKAFAVAGDGRRLVVVDESDKHAELWGTLSEISLRIDLRPDEDDNSIITCLRFSPDNKMLAVGNENGEILIWGASEQ